MGIKAVTSSFSITTQGIKYLSQQGWEAFFVSYKNENSRCKVLRTIAYFFSPVNCQLAISFNFLPSSLSPLLSYFLSFLSSFLPSHSPPSGLLDRSSLLSLANFLSSSCLGRPRKPLPLRFNSLMEIVKIDKSVNTSPAQFAAKSL